MDDWQAVNMFTGEVKPLSEIDPKTKKHRKPDEVFTALARLCGYDGHPLTDSLRGALNKACREIKDVETGTYDEIVSLIDAFGPWFKSYRRERFNEYCRRAPYPMETAKLWTEYRKSESNIGLEMVAALKRERADYDTSKDIPGTVAYRLAHRHDNEGSEGQR